VAHGITITQGEQSMPPKVLPMPDTEEEEELQEGEVDDDDFDWTWTPEEDD